MVIKRLQVARLAASEQTRRLNCAREEHKEAATAAALLFKTHYTLSARNEYAARLCGCCVATQLEPVELRRQLFGGGTEKARN